MLEQLFIDLLNTRRKEVEKTSRWLNSKFEHIKYLSATDKGELGELFIQTACEKFGFKQVHRPQGHKGQFDISIQDKTFEIKTASLDTSGNFQFNGIRYDTKYQYLLLFGVAPEKLYVKIYAKSELTNIKLVPMRKGSNSDFKHTLSPKK